MPNANRAELANAHRTAELVVELNHITIDAPIIKMFNVAQERGLKYDGTTPGMLGCLVNSAQLFAAGTLDTIPSRAPRATNATYLEVGLPTSGPRGTASAGDAR